MAALFISSRELCANPSQAASLVRSSSFFEEFVFRHEDCATLRQKTDTNDSSGHAAFYVQYRAKRLAFQQHSV